MGQPLPGQALSPKPFAQPASAGRLLGLLTAAFYTLFTLLPNSNSLAVLWPWVLIWQIGLALPLIWLLWQVWRQQRLMGLGKGLDWLVGFTVLTLLLNSIFAEFPNQARWYAWAALCCLAALYALSYWLQTAQRRDRLLHFQGYLGLTFIVLSLGWWIGQTVLPELGQLQTLNPIGFMASLDFHNTSLRNWRPVGHPNYVAGYLLLVLPLLLGLGIHHSDRRRWLWLLGVGLGIIDLYTTGSRGGWLGLWVLVILSIGMALWRGRLPRSMLMLIGIGLAAVLILFAISNNRLRSLLLALLNDPASGELSYRLITHAIGWQMGIHHPWFGIGLGSVPLTYQKYHPTWAGREAELAYQLHSTPVQLWAEMGIGGIILLLGTMALLFYFSVKWIKRVEQPIPPSYQLAPVLIWSLFSSLITYAVFSLTDYQLDNLCISGALTLFGAVLGTEFRQRFAPVQPCQQVGVGGHLRISQWLAGAGVGLLLSAGIWLFPIHRAWALSSAGFLALDQHNINLFTQRLEQAHRLVPWEPYYPYQLGWNLGNLAYQETQPAPQQALRQGGVKWLQQGIETSPYREFGYSNLGWLLVNTDARGAIQAFLRSAQLTPAKRGVFLGLGYSLLQQNRVDLSVEAITLEVLRHPLLITSPLWQVSDLKRIYPQVIQQLEAQLTSVLQHRSETEPLNQILHRIRAGLRWWWGDWEGARLDMDRGNHLVGQIFLDLAAGKSVETKLQQLPKSSASLAIAAWLNPSERAYWLTQAWLASSSETTQTLPTQPPADMLQTLIVSMDNSATFDQWLKQQAPTRQVRSQRLGFGVLSRHIDGPLPQDFSPRLENIPMVMFFDDVLPSPTYLPAWDRALQIRRDALLQKVLS